MNLNLKKQPYPKIKMSEEIACAHIWVSGRVQGVFFRAHTQDIAEGLKLAGWVRNLYDGRVEIVAQGPKHKVEQLIRWCHKGPPFSKVTNVEVRWEEAKKELKGFRVTY